MKILFKLLICEIHDEEYYNKIWILSFELINHKSGESILTSCGFSVLCLLLDNNFKQNLSEEDLNSILIFSNENAKIIEPIYRFIANFNDTTIINALFEKGLMSNIISILQQKKIESSIVLRFLKTIDYIPAPNDIIFSVSIELFNSQLNPVKISAVNYASFFLQHTPSSEIMSAIPKPPFLLLSSLIDESDLEVSFSSIKIIERILNIMINEGIKVPSNIVANKIVSALDEIYGLNQEIDEKADLIIQILHPEN
ncbi:hypothetical protein TVAG_006040 [Trichomonas vaginalis G3]|uniref:Uncharacterized protein n=1 Tax=Trichomonas vaginalis (strain ATCC PRA-98 / G3) TaxID=412133 RepID=A2E711_TRIV3|nr:hypothetical protein TVAGG3_0982540 [Trichomonas vaginalis G3]EAY11529.1 hypothetical protein TVAG_006040 [Trichomonas vaginalis G3]KAI5489413.1 hypothetical protein TVAGG3_0982540 [Trichomonas vaginalis G3]|eukprot:XP_001323752.1 hypothetical protein [Trichomonas vaginalis G3]